MQKTWVEKAPQQLHDSWVSYERKEQNKHVFINRAALRRFIAESPLAETEDPDELTPDWTFPEGIYEEDDRKYAQQTLVSGTINYAFNNIDGSKWELTNDQGGTLSGSTALHVRTREVFGDSDDITSDVIRDVATEAGMTEYLPGVPGADSRVRLLGDLALGLDKHYEGSVQKLLDASLDSDGNMRAYNGGKGLVERLLHRDFGDAYGGDHNFISTPRGAFYFPFHKRAHLAPTLYYGRARKSAELPDLVDIHEVGTICDYNVPVPLRAENILSYSPDLARRVDSRKFIARGSREEVEIRAASGYVQGEFKRGINEIRHERGLRPISIAPLDAHLFLLGRKLAKSGDAKPHHLTTTTAY